MRLRPIASACVLAGITLLVSLFRIASAPLSAVENDFNAQAESVHPTHAPLFFHVREERWLQPIAVYANVAARAIGGDDVSGRLVSAVAAASGVALVFVIAHEVTGRLWVGAVAALILMLTPAYRSFGQVGTDVMAPVPLLLLWVWNLLRFLARDSIRALAAAAALLGVSAYSHPAAPLTAMMLWSLTLVVARRRKRSRLLAVSLVFGAAWLPAAIWFLRRPETYLDTFGRWFVFAAHLRNPLDGLRAFINPGTLGNRASLYWGFWDPSWLFFSTPDHPAPLLMMAAPLIAFGAARCLKHLPRDTTAILIGTALVAPLAGATFGVPHYLSDAAIVMPVLALCAAFGADQLLRLLTRRPLEDGVTVVAVNRWDDDDASPRV